MKVIIDTFLIILIFLVIFVQQSTIKDYTLAISFFLFIIYGLSALLRKQRYPRQSLTTSFDILIFISIGILLVFGTGGLYSPLFFLLYFLGFGITFVFEPIMIFLVAFGIAMVFLPEAITNNALESYLKIASIFLTALLGYFFGYEYKKKDKEEELQK